MDYLVKIRSVQTPLNGQFSIGANTVTSRIKLIRGSDDLYLPAGAKGLLHRKGIKPDLVFCLAHDGCANNSDKVFFG